MKGYEVDPKLRAFARSKLPPELLAIVDNAEANANERVDQIVSDFSNRVKQRIEAFAETDFSAELEAKYAEHQEALLDELDDSVHGLAQQISELNRAAAAAAAADPAIQQSIDELQAARSSLDAKLKKARDGSRNFGSRLGQFGRVATTKFLGGLF